MADLADDGKLCYLSPSTQWMKRQTKPGRESRKKQTKSAWAVNNSPDLIAHFFMGGEKVGISNGNGNFCWWEIKAGPMCCEDDLIRLIDFCRGLKSAFLTFFFESLWQLRQVKVVIDRIVKYILLDGFLLINSCWLMKSLKHFHFMRSKKLL